MAQKNEMINNYFSEDEVKGLAKDYYNLDTTEIHPLDGEIDQNYYLKTSDDREYVFKIANPNRETPFLEAQVEAIARAARVAPCQEVMENRDGQTITVVPGKNETNYRVWIVTFLPGTIFAELDTHSPELLKHLGASLGLLDNELKDFHHPAVHRYLRWDAKNAADMVEYSRYIDDIERRRVVRYFLQQFQTFAVPVFGKLRAQIIYNDANDYNILVSDDGKRVTGIIDFGDMVHTYLVSEPAIAIAYAIHGKDDPLETAAHIVKGYHDTHGLTEQEADVLFYFVCVRLCMTLCNQVDQQRADPGNEYLRISVEPAWNALEKLMRVSPQQAARAFREACGMQVDDKGLSKENILDIRKQNLGRSLSISYKKPLKIVRGAMQYLYDENGRAYLDTVNNVCHVGHCHPRVVKAGQEQMALLNTNTRFLHDHIVEYAQELTATLPDRLSVCHFVCTGSEANELALRMAKIYTGRKDIVVVDHGYHGNTNLLIEISPYKFDGPGGQGAGPHVHKVSMPDVYRGIYKKTDPEAGKKYAEDIKGILEKLAAEGRAPAAFIAESIAGVGGQVFWPENYLKHMYEYIRETGGVCIADEVQVGFGRVGSHWWAFETQNVVPDIVTVGKPIGNGHPLAAVVTTPEIAEAFNNGMEYFNTFGGNPVSCAIGKAVLDVIKEDKLRENALETGEYFKAGLAGLMEKHDLIGDVRGMGLFIGAELVKDRKTLEPAKEEAYAIAEEMKNQGILISIDGPLHNVLKIKPPIVFNKQNADQYVNTLDKILTCL